MLDTSNGDGPWAVADLTLARRAREGDPIAAERVAERLTCVRHIVATLHARMGRPLGTHDLEEVVQDVQGALWTKLDRYDGQRSLEAWAWGFCGLELVKYLERRRRRERLEYGVNADRYGGPASPRDPAAADYDWIHRALQRLDPRAGAVVRLKSFDGLTFEQIGQRLAMPVNTAKTHYYRALVRLRRSLSARWHHEGWSEEPPES